MLDIDTHLINTFLPMLTGVNRDVSLGYLTVVMENGNSKASEIFIQEEGKSKEEALEITKMCTGQLLLFFPNAETLLEDEHFKMSLRLTVGKIIKDLLKEKNSIGGWDKIFLSRLNEIFPPDWAEIMWSTTVIDICCDREEIGKNHWLPPWDEIEKYYAWRKGLQNLSHVISERPAKPAGTETWWEKCPNPGCKEPPKRMDKTTKRFRCKCGVNKPYPFK